MMKIPILRVLTLVLCVLAQVALVGAEKERTQWLNGPAQADLKSLAEIQIPAGARFAGPADAERLLSAMGNFPSGRELGLISSTNDWFVVFEFSDDGYVKDDDKNKLDAAKLLKAITEGTEEANKERAKQGHAPLKIIGWEQQPAYNPETHNLEWSIRAESGGEQILNHNTRILGRRGVMEVVLVVEPDKFSATIPEFKALLKTFKYKEGERYAEYRQGDKIAKYGLAALITGGAAAVALKTGLFAKLGILLVKGGKAIVVGLIAVGAFVKNLFTRKKNQPSE